MPRFKQALYIALPIVTIIITMVAIASVTRHQPLAYTTPDFIQSPIVPPATMTVPVVGPSFVYDEIILSHPPGVYDAPFYLTVHIADYPHATIYFTLDGTDPAPGNRRYLLRQGYYLLPVTGSFPQDSQGLKIADKTGDWRYSILAAHTENWDRSRDVTFAPDAPLLRGQSLRLQGFVGDQPVTDILVANFLILPDVAERFQGLPIVFVNAPYQDFLYIYSHADPFDLTVRRRVFDYAYFTFEHGWYTQQFLLPGSTSLGGVGSRRNAQRTMNAHFSRGELEGRIPYPMFGDIPRLERFRMWNGGNAFRWDHMRDVFAQQASQDLEALYSSSQLAIKFINGEYWGFTTLREHTSNRHFVSAHTGLSRSNVAIIDRNRGEHGIGDYIAEGDEVQVFRLHRQLIDFLYTADLSTDPDRARLFDEFFCPDNLMDYVISNTFFHNTDWPYNNMRLFRAIQPDPDSDNPYLDGRWRFILHDMDHAPPPYPGSVSDTRFHDLLDICPRAYASQLWLNNVFLVLNNPTFASEFVARAQHVTQYYFAEDRLVALHDQLLDMYTPLLGDMYARFAIYGTVEESLENFNAHAADLRHFITHRHGYYLAQLDRLYQRVADQN